MTIHNQIAQLAADETPNASNEQEALMSGKAFTTLGKEDKKRKKRKKLKAKNKRLEKKLKRYKKRNKELVSLHESAKTANAFWKAVATTLPKALQILDDIFIAHHERQMFDKKNSKKHKRRKRNKHSRADET